MRPRDIVVIGASAGGIAPLVQIVTRLPAQLQATLFIVMHRVARHRLREALQTASSLPVEVPWDLERIANGRAYVAPADAFMFLENGVIRVEQSPKDFIYRPSINMLFRSAASVYGRRVAGIILSGTLTDGIAGLWEIKKRGGVTIVQEPDEAGFNDMPVNALAQVSVDYTLPAHDIAQKIVELCARPAVNGAAAQRNVLIVEDEHVLAEHLRARFEGLNYRVCACVSSGEEAIAAAEMHEPDVILMDIRLAGPLSGIEAARRIWARFQTPIVYVTAYADERTLAQAKTTTCYGYVVKPFHFDAMRAAVELALDRREKELRALASAEE
jgi:chemotaxis response regulator CheB